MSKMRAVDDGSGGPADFNRTRETEDDVEGHVSKSRLTGPDGISHTRNAEGPEGISHTRISRSRVDEGEDDVKGHIGRFKSPASRGE